MNGNDERVQLVARVAGILMLVTIVAGFFGEVYVPSHIIVSKDAAATAANIATHESLFRIGFASYLVEAICDVALSLLFFVLLRPVQKNMALLSAFFGLVSTAVYAVTELSFFAAMIVLKAASDLAPFSVGERQGLAYVFVKVFTNGGGLFMAFYGIAAMVRGYLIFRSRYIPRTIGAFFMIAGCGFVAKNFTLVLAPSWSSDLLLAPMFAAAVSLTFWLLVKGVDVRQWQLARLKCEGRDN
jgi:hypothetical protein